MCRRAFTKARVAMDSGLAASLEYRKLGQQTEAWHVPATPDEVLILTDKEIFQAEVSRRTSDLQRSNDELRQFAYAASHDLREPLLKVRAFGQRLQEKYSDKLDEKGREYLRIMLEATQRMQARMDDLLQYSRVGRPKEPMEKVNLGDVVRQVVDDLQVKVEETQAMVQVGVLPTILANPIQMGMVFQNLISNSLKFRHPERVPKLTITAQSVDGEWVISVADNGIGFDMRFKEKIFQIFERLHPRSEYPGTGIGLALCKKIIDRHQGWIDCESDPGKGATFIVGVPQIH